MTKSLILVSLCAATALFTGCATTEGHDRAAETADQVVELGGSAGQTQLRLDNTLVALEKVVATAQQDPKPAYATFVREYEAFTNEFAGLTKDREMLKAKSATWFTEFEKQNNAIGDADLREAGTKRLAEFREQVAEVSEQVDELMSGTSSLNTRLKDVRTFLGNDLTPKGIDTVSGRIGDAAKEGRKFAAGLGKLSKSSTDLAAKMRAARMPKS